MTEILVPFGNEYLALSMEQLAEARRRGRELVPVATPSTQETPDELLDAAGMEKRTGVPASWFEEAARQERVPCVRFGKYVRFRLNEVLEHLSSTRRRGGKANQLKLQAVR